MTSTNQTAIVTGAGQGAGTVIARKLASRGINILVADVNETTSQKVVQELKDDFGVDAVFVKTDISIEEDVRNMVQTVVDRWGRLDWACNNACVVEAMALDEDNVTTEQFDRMYAVNQRGNWLCQKYECIQMRSQEPRPVTLFPSSRTVMQRGAVVTISSVNGNTGAGLPGYSAAKAAILSLARTGAQFYGPYDVRVNVVSPGPIAHDGFSRWLETQSPEIVKFIEGTTSSTPLRRQAYPEEVADTVNWLLSDGSTFITGANIICDGGLLAARF